MKKGSRPKGPTLDEATFQNLRRRITSTSGIYVLSDENSRFLLERRLMPRLRRRGICSFPEYEALLDADELDEMLDVVAVHETYFFREKRQLKVFSEQIIPELARGGGPIRIWSAGCSTGEEAYTIAMLLAEEGLLDGRSEVIASDLSNRVIESGKRGVYGASSFRTTEPHFKGKYFGEIGKGLWRANDALQSALRFERANLVGPGEAAERNSLGADDGFDVIFCRNVLMYFDEAAVKKTLSTVYPLLKDGGYLLLGHAESLLPIGSGFKAVQIGRELIHKK
ncbi:MAG TPA: protein-glutamate O-methyltransferase CheR [Blastocatellia bacterium]|nr:protein-glutamate O-methyltransferase CheR [Blastocatellia bacterium]